MSRRSAVGIAVAIGIMLLILAAAIPIERYNIIHSKTCNETNYYPRSYLGCTSCSGKIVHLKRVLPTYFSLLFGQQQNFEQAKHDPRYLTYGNCDMITISLYLL